MFVWYVIEPDEPFTSLRIVGVLTFYVSANHFRFTEVRYHRENKRILSNQAKHQDLYSPFHVAGYLSDYQPVRLSVCFCVSSLLQRYLMKWTNTKVEEDFQNLAPYNLVEFPKNNCIFSPTPSASACYRLMKVHISELNAGIPKRKCFLPPWMSRWAHLELNAGRRKSYPRDKKGNIEVM